MVCRWNPAIDRLLQDYFLDILGSEAALDERRADMHAKLIPLVERHHGADDKHAARSIVEMRSCPDLAPGVTGYEILKLGIKCGLVGVGTINPSVAEHLATASHADLMSFLLFHCNPLPMLLLCGDDNGATGKS